MELGTLDEMEQLHKVMIECGFDNSSDVFIRTLTESMLEKRYAFTILDSLVDSIQIIEDFASLVTDCMFAEKRRTKSSSTRVSQKNPVMFKPLID
ncbi:hypothetical protein ANCDUO_06345 [Ancylostoma duodenale]|uniref:Uncharacterized protein n=1 Tax=Ancylostoma duodenale TaxID=51022 RepID=A0A0C2GWE8_9BILA|nr:hypothetical protein ANCDUO_06345 [Ancylostoma duodenale]